MEEPPSLHGSHAVYIGDEITMLKPYLKEDVVIPNPVMASRDGLSRQPVTGHEACKPESASA